MSVLRTSRDFSLTQVAAETAVSPALLDKLILNRNCLEIGKTAHVMDAIPETLDYQYGRTIGNWFLAPIPREIWNSKPLISTGPIIGTKVYKQEISGVPPGFVGEMYWNFDIIGVIVGSLLLGWLLKYFHVTFSPVFTNSMTGMIFYVYGPMKLGYLVLGNSFGFGFVNTLISMATAYLVLICLKVNRFGY